ncbi:MAG: glutaminyl-peptide cyclotransferase, partial [Owenweeksia sp.]
MKFIKVVEKMLKRSLTAAATAVLALILMQACNQSASDRIRVKTLHIETPASVYINERLSLHINDDITIDSLLIKGAQPETRSEDQRQFSYSFHSSGVKQIQFKAFTGEGEYHQTIAIKVIPEKGPEKLQYEVIKTLSHASNSYTQGLEFYKGELFESKGQYGSSAVQKIEFPAMKVSKEISLGSDYFGEGLTIMNEQIYQITWREKICFMYDTDLRGKGTLNLPVNEGWGITNDGSSLFVSDGSNRLYRMDNRMKFLDSREIYAGASPLSRLNELERANDRFYA